MRDGNENDELKKSKSKIEQIHFHLLLLLFFFNSLFLLINLEE